MKKLLLVAAALLCVASAAFAGSNSGTQAWLSWGATSQVLDANAAATNKLFIRFTRTSAMQFKGGEIDLTWDPASDFLGCFDHIGTVYKTSAGTTCTYLNRGSAVPVVVADDPNHFHVAWANNSSLTTCTAGTAIEVDFETDGCLDPKGCFSLNSAVILDSANIQDVCTISNAIVTVAGGAGHNCAATPVQPTTWGAIKSSFKN